MNANTATATLPGTASATADARNSRSLGYLIDIFSNMRTPIKGSLMIIGRETGLVLDGISRKHCMIRIEEGEAHVADMGSRYGTYLNDEKLAPNAWRSFSSTDELRLGGSLFRLELPVRSRAEKEKPETPVEQVHKEKAELQPKELPEGLELASLHDRFRGAAVNGILSTTIGLILGLILPKGSGASAFTSLFAMTVCTYAPMILWNQSLGKRLVGLKVVQDDGSPLDWQLVLFREFVMKTCSVGVVAMALVALASINQIFFFSCLIATPIAFVVKTRMDGMPYWDLICGTRVVLAEAEAEAMDAEPAAAQTE